MHLVLVMHNGTFIYKTVRQIVTYLYFVKNLIIKVMNKDTLNEFRYLYAHFLFLINQKTLTI